MLFEKIFWILFFLFVFFMFAFSLKPAKAETGEGFHRVYQCEMLIEGTSFSLKGQSRCPNWFWQTMQYLFFGVVYLEKETVIEDTYCSIVGKCPPYKGSGTIPHSQEMDNP